MTRSKIEWTEQTWNPVAGCTWVSPGCDNCYAARMTRRLEAMGHAKYAGLTTTKHFNGKIRTDDKSLDIPLNRKKPTMWFVNSMSDLFHKDVPFEFIDKVFAVMALAKQHTFQVLTKRPQWMYEFVRKHLCRDGVLYLRSHHDDVRIYGSWPLPNVWLGTSVENRDTMHRIDTLRECQAAVRFLSLEPLLEDLGEIDLHGINWVIVCGESGPGARRRIRPRL